MGSCVRRAECGDGLCGTIHVYRGAQCDRTAGFAAVGGTHGQEPQEKGRTGTAEGGSQVTADGWHMLRHMSFCCEHAPAVWHEVHDSGKGGIHHRDVSGARADIRHISEKEDRHQDMDRRGGRVGRALSAVHH